MVSVLGAGLPAHLEYVAVSSAIIPSPLSLAAQTGLPWIGYLLLALAATVVIVFRRSPEPTFALAVVAMALASPALYTNHFAVLLVALVPFAWRVSPASTEARSLSRHVALTLGVAALAMWVTSEYVVLVSSPVWTPPLAAVAAGIVYFWVWYPEPMRIDARASSGIAIGSGQ